jgi:hypothetical protein
MGKRLKPWWSERQWKVEALTPKGWQPIYCTRTKVQAERDAAAWKAQLGQEVRVVPGDGHKSRRDA